MTDTIQEKKRPTAMEIDSLCIAYDGAKTAADKASQKLSEVKGALLAVIQDYGYVPSNAEKTTRLEGTLYITDATTSSSVSINEAPVLELQSELSRLKLSKTFTEIFDRTVKHSLKKNASSTLKVAIGGFPEEVQARLLGIFASSISVETKAPSVKVELAAALRAKEEEAQRKAEAKATKAAAKAEREAKKAAKAKA